MQSKGQQLSRTPQRRAAIEVFLENPSEEFYGLQLAELTHLETGTVYPILKRFHDDGWLDKRWESADLARVEERPQRRLYRLTSVGEFEGSRYVASFPHPSRQGEPRVTGAPGETRSTPDEGGAEARPTPQ
jgi:DNA-binding PadR family transcriptional regulator